MSHRKGGVPKKSLDHLHQFFEAGQVASARSAGVSANAWLAWQARQAFKRPIVVVTESAKALDEQFHDLETFAGADLEQLFYFPAEEGANTEAIGDRLRGLYQLSHRQKMNPVLATSIQAIMPLTISAADLEKGGVQVRRAEEYDLDQLVEHFIGTGFEFGPEVIAKGQACMRGGLLDVWPPQEDWPVRLEFFGPVLESIRTFDPFVQRSVEKIDEVWIGPAIEHAEREVTPVPFHTYLPNAVWLWVDVDGVQEHAALFEATLKEHKPANAFLSLDTFREGLRAGGGAELMLGGTSSENELLTSWSAIQHIPALLDARTLRGTLEEQRNAFVVALSEYAAQGYDVRISFTTEGTRDRFKESWSTREEIKKITLQLGHVAEGFLDQDAKCVFVGERDLYGHRKVLRNRYDPHKKRRGPQRVTGSRVTEWSDMQPGEYVVHIDHGIGRYRGIFDILFNGKQQEVLSIEYSDKAQLHVPVSQSHLLSRYVGAGKRKPVLHKLGGRKWNNEKLAAQAAVQDLSAFLLDTQAARETLQGYAFGVDTEWQKEFEASFPYQETEDQSRAISEVKADMESRKPMDRLICGDVGYGKTEVAIRAAFKAVMDGKQVAILVPTTILAQQHYENFIERMSAFPVKIEMLSRFRTKAEQRDAIALVEKGEVDIVIGTHRLVQPDVRFRDLGLVIIDEEQRFGVEHKERLKQLRQLVDILTLTATPIPRTLYMSLTGARDMSTIQTAPRERQSVETIVSPFREEVIRNAVLHELNREGQVFFLHNRVQSISMMKEKLMKIVPEARILVAHGQMPERLLESVMHRFVDGDFDVLLCTTIIESGVDIPNVNTIIIDAAQRFGMADLYQLRGRVGRSKKKAYAYLLTPPDGHLFSTARNRILALQRFSSLGSGFKLALRDLELRGAGNLLGAKQSGHISAVGFELYCQLLQRTIAQQKGEPVRPVIDVILKIDFVTMSPGDADDDDLAAIPFCYVEDEQLRLTLYRKIAGAVSKKEVKQLREELQDRFGPIPQSVDVLLTLAGIRIATHNANIIEVETREGKIMLRQKTGYIMPDMKFPRLQESATMKKLREIMRCISTHTLKKT